MPSTKRALLSVSNKTGIAAFGKGLVDRGFQLLSTGGTARELRSASLPVTGVSEVTGHPEIMDGRVKTLHPAIHGPLLARRDVPEDLEALKSHRYSLIDVVAVNLYPFRETVARGEVPVPEAMEQVDIGGPTMLRAAAKNHAHVLVVVDPSDYPRVLAALDGEVDDEEDLRRELAGKVFRHTGAYDAAIARYLSEELYRSRGGEEGVPGRPPPPPPLLVGGWTRGEPLRYGENPDQAAAFYTPEGQPGRGIAGLEQHHGKALSYNNLLDLDGALLCLSPFALSRKPSVCIVKHTTPSGLAIGDSVEEAYRKALATDPVSAFGSVIAVNREVDGAAAKAMGELFVECVVAPAFTDEAIEILTGKKNLRILTFPEGSGAGAAPSLPDGVAEALTAFEKDGSAGDGALRAARFLVAHGRDPDPFVPRGIYGGLLIQTAPVPPFLGIEPAGWDVVTRRTPTAAEKKDLAFAWAAVYGVKSNAILLARDGATLGIGAGQMSRVDASRLAVQKAGDAGLELEGCALASDAFFPFRDGVDAAAEAGVKAIIQPGGSVRDEEVIEAANEHGMTMIFTGRRLFRH
jgi:phosphoribosylaminoimidazolecarboxamide formyltransferase / IMP cyclohydrolase